MVDSDLIGLHSPHKIPFGFIKKGRDKGKLFDYKDAVRNPKSLVHFENLTFEHKKEIVISYWSQGFWSDVVIKGQSITKDETISAVKEIKQNELQLEKEPSPFALLLELTLLTYERMYEGLFMNKRAFNIDAPKTYDVPETAEVKHFSISRAMKIPIKIYKIYKKWMLYRRFVCCNSRNYNF